MLYLVYNHITTDRFKEIKSKIVALENELTIFMLNHRFRFNEASLSDEGLGLDYLYDDKTSKFKGGLAFEYIDEEHKENKELFTFYVLKSIDIGTERLYKKAYVSDGAIKIKDIEEKWSIYLEECIGLFFQWQKKDLTERIDLI